MTLTPLTAAMYYAHYGMDGALESTPGGTELYYIHNDHLGTPQAVTTSAANPQVVWSATYDPFGKATVAAGSSITLNLRFPGQYYDQETGLHYNYFRDYDPSTGRYIESDPIGLKGGLNPFIYVENNPINWYDENGLERRGRNRTPGPHPDTTVCSYYSEACSKYGCGYYCYWAPLICSTADMNPMFKRDPTATTENLNCVRRCLAREDKKVHDNKPPCEDGCLTDEEVDGYHITCFTECGVNPDIYPGVGIFNL